MTTGDDTSTGLDARTWQVIAHLSALVGLVGVPSVVGPLVVWLVRRHDPEVEPHAREALNFHLSLLIYGVAGVVLAVVLALSVVGLLLLPLLVLGYLALAVLGVVFSILGAVKASDGVLYRYPLNLRLIAPGR